MGKEIKLCLVYRDMWQSSGKYMPRVDQLERIAPEIINMGCFARVETNGGGFEQINLLYGENPNQSVRRWTQPFNDAGIQTLMLERGLNGIRMNPVPKDVRKLMFKVKKAQGTDIARSFDGLNYVPNLANSFTYAREAGMIAQGALCITYSKLHTVEYFINLADQMIELGAEEICIKDMAGIGRPVSIGKIIKGIKDRHPDVLVQYHGHSTPGFSIVSSLEAARNGADIIDVGMEPLSWGTGHADVLTVHAMLEDAGFSLPEIDMTAYMKARSLSQEFIDDFLGYYINPQNRKMNPLLIGPGLPGGMMGSLMSDLEKSLQSLNKWLTKRDKEPIAQEDLLIRLFQEVEHIWPQMGYPPLVTPYSQYVKNVALMNVTQMIKGKERFSMVDENTWNMLLGKAGKLPGPLGDSLLQLAQEQDREFFHGVPQDLYPDELPFFAHKMDEKGWDYGEDDEELMEFAMHPPQYEDYRSGKAKERFLADLEQRKAAANGSSQHPSPAAKVQPAATLPVNHRPKQLNITVNGEAYSVSIAYPEAGKAEPKAAVKPNPTPTPAPSEEEIEILAPLEGKFYLTKDPSEKPLKVGDAIQKGATIGYIEAMKVYNAITADQGGTIVEILPNPGDEIEEDDILMRLK